MTRPLFLQAKFVPRNLILAFILFMHASAFGQVRKKNFQEDTFSKYAAPSVNEFADTRPYYIIAWGGKQPQNIRIIRQLSERTAIIELNNRQEFNLLKQQAKVAEAVDQWKFSPTAERISSKDKKQSFILSSFNLDSLLKSLTTMTDEIRIISINRASRSVVVNTTPKFLRNKLLPLNEVIFIDVRSEPHSEIGVAGYNRSFNGINAVDYSIPGANGKNIVVGVKEQKMNEQDLDIYKRVLSSSISSTNVTSHATTIATLIGGAGNSFYDGRGIAYGCKFFPSSFDNLFADDETILHSNSVTLQNHSYGTIIQQFYGAEAVSYDVHAWQDKNFIHVFSAGNAGTDSALDGPYANIAGYANITGNFKMAKNVITVGAIDDSGNLPLQSSAGPIYDGRLAPQLVALGPSGTSDAAAIVSGTIAVMQQVYADSNSNTTPPASLIKAVLYNTAEDIYRRGIDYKTGYGMVNSYAAIRSIQRKEFDGEALVKGNTWTKVIKVPLNAAQFKVTLAWTDTPSTVNNNKALINDLDLEVKHGVTIYKPWVLNAAANVDSLSQLPIRKRDSLNTSELVSIQLPQAGDYLISVSARPENNSSIQFHLAYHIDTLNTFAFTSPQHTSDINREEDENLVIRWKSFVADTNQTGKLFISYDRGSSWQFLQSAKLYSNQYRWQVKDTTSTAVLKMETLFGNFLSNEFIIGKVIRPAVDFLCTDSFQLSWNKYPYANAYKVYTLTDSPYLKQILATSDTVISMKRSVNSPVVYAVEPLLSNNIPAARSIAIDIGSQGVKCFYKTFYYNLLSQNVLELVLELSGLSYIDSVSFEQLTAEGQLLTTYGELKTNSAEIYKHKVNDLPAGTSYWRGKIKLKNGTVLFTETVSVITSGKKYILFYPNPVNRNGVLNYTLQQDLPAGSRLQFFDVLGRKLKDYSKIPDEINLRSFSPGLVVYKLFSGDNKLLEIGKLVVQ